jgi:hypothetical protein
MRIAAPDALAGRRVKCPRCGEELTVPQQSGAAPDWMAAPPPVRRPLPAPAPTPATAPAAGNPQTAAGPDPAPQADPSPAVAYDEPEPWYYRFIERYTIVLLCIWIAVLTLVFGAVTVGMLYLGAQAAKAGVSDGPLGGCSLFLQWLFAAAGYALAVCGAVFAASWLLLALDAARNLRRIRIKLPGD